MESLVQRKVTWMRNSAYLCLPRSWVIETGLRKGDQIAISLDHEDNLILQPRTLEAAE